MGRSRRWLLEALDEAWVGKDRLALTSRIVLSDSDGNVASTGCAPS
jgi:hypothetical protein